MGSSLNIVGNLRNRGGSLRAEPGPVDARVTRG
jgi:hypothetical protein